MDRAQFIGRYAYACDQWEKEEHQIFSFERRIVRNGQVLIKPSDLSM